MKKPVFSIICSALLVLTNVCAPIVAKSNTTAAEPNEEFTAFLKEDFIDTVDEDYLTLHNYVRDPSAYGIDESTIEVSLGEVNEVYTKEYKQELRDLEKKLAKFDRSTLDAEQQAIYDEYMFENEIADEAVKTKYKYISNAWSQSSGLPQSLVSVFSEFRLYDESDIADLITLINDVPRYTEDTIAYSKQQAKRGCLRFRYKDTISYINSVLKNQDDSAVYQGICESIDELNLGEEKSTAYKAQVKEALDNSFFPSYTYMKTELKKLKSDVKSETNMSKQKNGKSYYAKVMIPGSASTEKSVDTIYNSLSDEFNSSISKLRSLYKKGADSDVDTGFNYPEDILSFIKERYTSDFPEISEFDYHIQALSDEQSIKGVVAYYSVPAIDDTGYNQIHYNKRDYGSETNTLDFYTTMAHEGLPGHMYATQYVAQNHNYDIEYLFSNLGAGEGYAIYAEKVALDYLPASSKDLNYYFLNNYLNYLLICMVDIDYNYNGLSVSELANQYSLDESDIKSVIEDVADRPTAFLSYYYGYYRISQMRTRAENELGDEFDEKSFHKALLEWGEINLDLRDKHIDQYIQSAKA